MTNHHTCTIESKSLSSAAKSLLTFIRSDAEPLICIRLSKTGKMFVESPFGRFESYFDIKDRDFDYNFDFRLVKKELLLFTRLKSKESKFLISLDGAVSLVSSGYKAALPKLGVNFKVTPFSDDILEDKIHLGAENNLSSIFYASGSGNGLDSLFISKMGFSCINGIISGGIRRNLDQVESTLSFPIQALANIDGADLYVNKKGDRLYIRGPDSLAEVVNMATAGQWAHNVVSLAFTGPEKKDYITIDRQQLAYHTDLLLSTYFIDNVGNPRTLFTVTDQNELEISVRDSAVTGAYIAHVRLPILEKESAGLPVPMYVNLILFKNLISKSPKKTITISSDDAKVFIDYNSSPSFLLMQLHRGSPQ